MIKTKQELLNHFSDINAMYNNPFMYQTLSNMIDELLEQQPCDDCISRKDALKVIEEQKKGFYGVERYAIDECHSAVMKLPSVRTPQSDGKTSQSDGKTSQCDNDVTTCDTEKEKEKETNTETYIEKDSDLKLDSDLNSDSEMHEDSSNKEIPCREIVEDKRACEKCIHYVTRDSRGVVLCGCDSWECDFKEVKT